jgi:hypothetical protein
MIDAGETDFALLQERIEQATHEDKFLSGRTEIIDYYQDRYGANWKSHIVDALVAITGKSRNTVSREFQYDKRTGQERYKSGRVTAATREKYEKLGKTLPPYKVPKNVKGKRARVHFQGSLWFSNKRYAKDFTRTLSIEQTNALLETGAFDAIIDAYEIDPDTVESLQIDDITIDFV